jgi:antitoxin (DNA-binding transcriptional repressor) of toxin-antitoxin stability system
MTETIVNIHEAKTHLSRLLQRVQAGERVVIAKAGRPIATIERIPGSTARRTPGRDKGVVIVGPDFDDPLPEFDPDYSHPEDPLRPDYP